jgi:hypothetical protein
VVVQPISVDLKLEVFSLPWWGGFHAAFHLTIRDFVSFFSCHDNSTCICPLIGYCTVTQTNPACIDASCSAEKSFQSAILKMVRSIRAPNSHWRVTHNSIYLVPTEDIWGHSKCSASSIHICGTGNLIMDVEMPYDDSLPEQDHLHAWPPSQWSVLTSQCRMPHESKCLA